jgi:hypothetical protein
MKLKFSNTDKIVTQHIFRDKHLGFDLSVISLQKPKFKA